MHSSSAKWPYRAITPPVDPVDAIAQLVEARMALARANRPRPELLQLRGQHWGYAAPTPTDVTAEQL